MGGESFISEYEFRISSSEIEHALFQDASILNRSLVRCSGFREMKILRGRSHARQVIVVMNWTEEKEYELALSSKEFKQFIEGHKFIEDHYIAFDFPGSKETAKSFLAGRKKMHGGRGLLGRLNSGRRSSLSLVKTPSTETLFLLAFILGITLAILILIYR